MRELTSSADTDRPIKNDKASHAGHLTRAWTHVKLTESKMGAVMGSPRIPKPMQVAPRNFANERLLCEAIQRQLVVRFLYKDDLQDREFEPAVVYHSPTGKVCVSGIVRSNPNDPQDDLGAHNFEVGLMSGVNVTLIKFVPNHLFVRDDPKYRFGIVCPL